MAELTKPILTQNLSAHNLIFVFFFFSFGISKHCRQKLNKSLVLRTAVNQVSFEFVVKFPLVLCSDVHHPSSRLAIPLTPLHREAPLPYDRTHIQKLWYSVASGRYHALVPFAVGHESPIMVGTSALVGLLLPPVQHCLEGLALAFGSALHIAGRRRSVPFPVLHSSPPGLGPLPQHGRVLDEQVSPHTLILIALFLFILFLLFAMVLLVHQKHQWGGKWSSV